MYDDPISLLQELVAIPSINPDSAAAAEQGFTGEEKIGRRVGEILRKLGADVRFDEVEPGRLNVIGQFPSSGQSGKRILLAPHLDTVGIAGMRIDPFAAEIRDDKLFGRGASDTKGTMAAMLAALSSLRNDLPGFDTSITFVGLIGEESGQLGSIDFGRRYGGQYDFAIVGEPTECKVVSATKGNTWIEIAVQGRAAHASTPDRGENAIAKAACLVGLIDSVFRPRLEMEFAHPELGIPTVNVGEIHGGTRANIVPDRCKIMLDIRTTPALDAADPLTILRETLSAAAPWITGHYYQLPPYKAMHLPEDNVHLLQLLESTGAERTVAPWFCDAAHLAAAGIPSVAAGPGSIAQAHTEDEWIALDALQEGMVFYRTYMESLG